MINTNNSQIITNSQAQIFGDNNIVIIQVYTKEEDFLSKAIKWVITLLIHH